MAFPSQFTNDPQKAAGGELYGNSHIILSAEKDAWLTGLNGGRFAISKAGIIQNADGTATPTIAGIVRRNPAGAVENDEAYTTDLASHVEYVREGVVSVYVKAGEVAPDLFGNVYMSNAGDADDGLATSTGTDVLTQAEFIREETAGVWLVNISKPVNA